MFTLLRIDRMLLRLALVLGIGVCLLAPAPVMAQYDFTTLHPFSGSEGANPQAALIQGTDGNLYGTAKYGGMSDDGTVFKMTPNGSVTALYAFSGSDGANPSGSLVQGTDGNFYGTTELGGANGDGTVFQITPTGTLTTLYSFSGSDGSDPIGALIQAADGSFYGTTEVGGANSKGTVFKITPARAFTLLHSFAGSDGADPIGKLIQTTNGSFYGTTLYGGNSYGTVFKMSSNGSVTVLYSFSASDGAYPEAGLIQGADGNFYGTTGSGGSGFGTVFKITPAGALTTLYNFTGGADGATPLDGLIQANDGNFYATTQQGGASSYGTIFKITSHGAETVIYNFTGGADGHSPRAGLIQGADGAFYGLTEFGGTYDDGTLFALTPTNPKPVLSSISPASTDAGGSAFTLIAKGRSFLSISTIDWNGSPLATTFVSATELKATVPASLIATTGQANVTVVTPSPGGGTSASKTFTILETTLKLTGAKLSKDASGNYIAIVSLKNTGHLTAQSTTVTQATLNGSAATNLPVTVGSIAAGATGTASLTFPSSAGSSGQSVKLALSGTFTGGAFTGSIKVTLP